MRCRRREADHVEHRAAADTDDVRMAAKSTAVNHAMDVRNVMPVVLDALAAGDRSTGAARPSTSR